MKSNFRLTKDYGDEPTFWTPGKQTQSKPISRCPDGIIRAVGMYGGFLCKSFSEAFHRVCTILTQLFISVRMGRLSSQVRVLRRWQQGRKPDPNSLHDDRFRSTVSWVDVIWLSCSDTYFTTAAWFRWRYASHLWQARAIPRQPQILTKPAHNSGQANMPNASSQAERLLKAELTR